MMSNELYLTLVYRPNVSRVSRALQSTQRSRAAIAEAQAEALRVMEERTALVDRVLRGFGPRTARHARAPRPQLLRGGRVPRLPGQRLLARRSR